MKSRILILCTGNSCRSQMAEGFLKSFDPELEVHSAGTFPARYVHPHAILVMEECDIDISDLHPKNVDLFLYQQFDYVITVCDSANESCPTFSGNVRNRVHIGFNDPAAASGTDEEIMGEFRRVRDEIRQRFSAFYEDVILRGL